MNDLTEIAAALVPWYRSVKRSMPWRETSDPYAIWVSEIMLQQTRVATVIPFYVAWMEAFPTIADLAKAPVDSILSKWTGLGYYSRARNLHKGAAFVVATHSGLLPQSAIELRAIPGIGPYTAGAISSIAFGKQEALVDGNVIRVLSRLFDIVDNIATATARKRFWTLAADLVPQHAPGDFNQGLMELGATVCLPKTPQCNQCPLDDYCLARERGVTADRPVKNKRPKRQDKKVIKRAALFAARDKQILLAKRRAEGLYGGLWELPLATSKKGLVSKASGALSFPSTRCSLRYSQELSHRVLDYSVWAGTMTGEFVCSDYEEVKWHDRETIDELGLSAATINMIEELRNSSKTKRRKK